MKTLEITFNGKLISIVFNSRLWEAWGPAFDDSGPYTSAYDAAYDHIYGKKNTSYAFYGEFDTIENCISHLMGLAKDGKI